MKHIRLACALGLALLAGCQGAGTPKPAVPPIEAALGDADNLLRAGQVDKAVALLETAAREHPDDKTPLLRIAQMRFDQGDYGAAIVHANGALQREPDNLLASSIVAVSGLRVASKALADLSSRNNLTGNVRNEAEDLAKLLRASLGEDVLVPNSRAAHAALAPKRHPEHPAPAGRPAASNDPFSALK